MKPSSLLALSALLCGTLPGQIACAKKPEAAKPTAPSPAPSSSAPRSGFNPMEPLRSFLQNPDTSYKWEKTRETELTDAVTLQEVTFTSQTWQGIPWTHHLSVLKPKGMKPNPTGLLYITGNYRPHEAPLFASLVAQAKQPLFILWDIPNQPLFDNLNEDALISYTFVKYLETQDASWPLLFPMTKGAVRAMDTAEALAKEDWKGKLSGFVVTGASKRGWTTWLTGGSDKRVKGIAPMVFDNLNFGPQMRRQIESWGQYSEQIQDYTEKGLQEQMETETGRKLTAMVDPYSYRQAIKIPKLIINGTNDRYWTLDSANVYFNDLSGPKNLLYVPNAGHGLEDLGRVMNGIGAFWSAVSQGKTLPQLRGEFSDATDGPAKLQLMLLPTEKPKAMRLWWTTSDTKDFRNAKWQAVSADSIKGSALHLSDTPGAHWLIVPDTVKFSPKVYAVAALVPEPGKFSAMFGEVEYPTADGKGSYTVSTQVRIVGTANDAAANAKE